LPLFGRLNPEGNEVIYEAKGSARRVQRQTGFDEPVAALPAWIDHCAATTDAAVTATFSHTGNRSVERQTGGNENE
jgi:hypothetical protein